MAMGDGIDGIDQPNWFMAHTRNLYPWEGRRLSITKYSCLMSSAKSTQSMSVSGSENENELPERSCSLEDCLLLAHFFGIFEPSPILKTKGKRRIFPSPKIFELKSEVPIQSFVNEVCIQLHSQFSVRSFKGHDNWPFQIVLLITN